MGPGGGDAICCLCHEREAVLQGWWAQGKFINAGAREFAELESAKTKAQLCDRPDHVRLQAFICHLRRCSPDCTPPFAVRGTAFWIAALDFSIDACDETQEPLGINGSDA